MNTFRLLSIAALLLTANMTLLAQKKVSKSKNIEVYSSKKGKRKAGETIDEFISIEDGKYTLRMRSKGMHEYVTYNSELEVEETKKKTIEIIKKKDYGLADWRTVQFAGSNYLIKATTDRDKKLNIFTLTELDEERDEIGPVTELDRIKGDRYYRIIENAYLDYMVSDDESKLMVMFKLPEKRDKDRVKYKLYRYVVFDEDLNIIWNRVFEYKHEGGRVKYGGSARVGDNGDVFCWASMDRGRGYKKDERFGVNLYRLNEDETAKVQIKALERDGITSFLHNGIYNLTSTYSKYGWKFLFWGGKGGKVGFLDIKWNGGDGESPEVKKSPFGAEHIIKNQPKKERKKWKKREKKGKPVYVPHLYTDYIIELEDGGTVILAQEQYAVTTTSKNGHTRTKYYNLDIHAFGMSADNDIQWSTIVPLYQKMGSTIGSGYAYKILGDKLYLIFNDNFRNLEREWNTSIKPNRFSGGSSPVSVVTIDMTDPDAKQKRELAWKSKTVGGLFRTEMFYSPYDNPIGLVYIQGGRLSERLLKIDFH
ncbi:MAG: hypothetical protein JKX84_09375 [Flavobacteriales bacterium]|nr:hypothetical protein [Flavobacteriales bacterium]